MKMKSVLLANVLFVVSTTLAVPCSRPTCGSAGPPPICPNATSSCGCRCNTTGPAPSPPNAHPMPPRPRPCGSGAGPTQTVPCNIAGNRVFAGCSILTCPIEKKLTCLRKGKFGGGGCPCKCIKWSDNCTMPWGPYECAHVCNDCMCTCVAKAPFVKPQKPPCKPITVGR
uniref:TIL domain containing protein n=1 Tax=Rhipicephalus appendiculatus TaxID=34631 RepID=A0A131Z5R7_RHIAP